VLKGLCTTEQDMYDVFDLTSRPYFMFSSLCFTLSGIFIN